MVGKRQGLTLTPTPLTVGHPLERLYREVRALRIAEGAGDVPRLNLARGSLNLNKGVL
jgi:alkylation response protein AidB-like acyl-CoA dehydrogenase